MLDFAAVVIAVAFVVLVGYVVPTVIQLRRTVTQSEQLLARINAELPELLNDLKRTNENVRVMSAQARESVEQASGLMQALGNAGQTVNQVHGAVRDKGTMLLVHLGRVLAGMKAMAHTVQDHVRNKEER